MFQLYSFRVHYMLHKRYTPSRAWRFDANEICDMLWQQPKHLLPTFCSTISLLNQRACRDIPLLCFVMYFNRTTFSVRAPKEGVCVGECSSVACYFTALYLTH
ncbi:hypothetical protein, unlikely [Trypanosoma brucei gambiense DAL972]|uniref:Uncharacterized protein n=1 Tax=Trypanosoma brucei gambiense (strain MHOM/CI/86/DAL972) TaxID=679716 RepID=C9ZLF4_TRYB9|nr:hypothetical protein, unlikely [Trypanosoma brucei gambiense DAL972]CBH10163.1 hypothetical protein, unlikely [Trypanosoma brucei gambiense DAL972]|eukprot:XP_011772453.1 hypothetical protein, unlikely [Trypanosoma brucei gambiense DAL972]